MQKAGFLTTLLISYRNVDGVGGGGGWGTGLITGKPVFRVIEQVGLKPACSSTDARKLEYRNKIYQTVVASSFTYEPRCEKTGLRGFRPGPTQTGLCSHRRWLEA